MQHVVRLGPRSRFGAPRERAAPVPPPQPAPLRPSEQPHHPPQVQVLPSRAEHVRDQRRITRHPAQHLRREQIPVAVDPSTSPAPVTIAPPASVTPPAPAPATVPAPVISCRSDQRDGHVQRRRRPRRPVAALTVRIKGAGAAAHLRQRLHPPLPCRTQVPLPGLLVRSRRTQRPDRRLQHRRLLRRDHQLVLRDIPRRHPRLRQPRHRHQPLLHPVQLTRHAVPGDHRRTQLPHLTRTPHRPQAQQRRRHRRHRLRLQARPQPGHLTQRRQRQPRRHRRVRHPSPHQPQRRTRVRLRRSIRRQRPTRTTSPGNLGGQLRDLPRTTLPQRARTLAHPRRARSTPTPRPHPAGPPPPPPAPAQPQPEPPTHPPHPSPPPTAHPTPHAPPHRTPPTHQPQPPSRSDAPQVPTPRWPCFIIIEHLFATQAIHRPSSASAERLSGTRSPHHQTVRRCPRRPPTPRPRDPAPAPAACAPTAASTP